ncbi:MAG TPA: ankyrin repeat domain-containing protein [Bryobacteraceae bacterium]|nr:ankyrin repeat domain-containing protein [Bryobacteraceae bacterium]
MLSSAAFASGLAEDPLLSASKSGDTHAVRALLNRGADLKAVAPDGSSALHWAAETDNLELAKMLREAGADVKAANRYGVTPLYLACTNGNAAMVELLLKAGAEADSKFAEGETALMIAARTGKLAAVEVLLAHGADVSVKERQRGQTALMWASAEGHTAVVERLIAAGADPRDRSQAGYSALMFAIRDGKADVVKTLLKAGADPNEALPPRARRRTGATEFGPPEGGASALDVAVANAHFEIAALLLDAGANPNAAAQGWTPLHTITFVRKPGTGSNNPAPPGSGNMDSLTLVRKLVAKGADVNARITRRPTAGLSALNTLGATPFLMAARTADAELMSLLAELGADPMATTEDKTTALMIAAGVGTRSPGEDAGTESEVLEAVSLAIKLGNDINAVDAKGETAMHGVAYKHLPAVAEYLAQNGANVQVWNRKNSLGWTPLRIAEGVFRTGNLRTSPPTAAAIRRIMEAAGLDTKLQPETSAAKLEQ